MTEKNRQPALLFLHNSVTGNTQILNSTIRTLITELDELITSNSYEVSKPFGLCDDLKELRRSPKQFLSTFLKTVL